MTPTKHGVPLTAGPRAGRESGGEHVVGVEHEFIVRRNGMPVDFRPLLPDLDVGVGGLDPADPLAKRGTWGGLITADGPEAEVVSPPSVLAAGATRLVAGDCAHGRRVLSGALGIGVDVAGFSTHLNIEVPRGSEVRVARRLTRQAAPALAMLLDQPSSPGILVRPRRGRIEVGGEYLAGDALRAALVVTAGLVEASRAIRRPSRVLMDVEPAIERYGWFVGRESGAASVHEHGRSARLAVGRRTIGAQQHLEEVWESARRHAARWASPEELALADRVVCGSAPLPMEDRAWAIADLDARQRPTDALGFGAALEPRSRPRCELAVLLATWDLVVFSVRGAARSAVIAVPRSDLRDFLARLDVGSHDASIDEFLASTPTGSVLRNADQAPDTRLFDEVGPLDGLLAPERDPATGRLMPPGRARDGKQRQAGPPPDDGDAQAEGAGSGSQPSGTPRRSMKMIVVAVIAGLVLLGGGLALALSRSEDSGTGSDDVASGPGSGSDEGSDSGPDSAAGEDGTGRTAATVTGATGLELQGSFPDVEANASGYRLVIESDCSSGTCLVTFRPFIGGPEDGFEAFTLEGTSIAGAGTKAEDAGNCPVQSVTITLTPDLKATVKGGVITHLEGTVDYLEPDPFVPNGIDCVGYDLTWKVDVDMKRAP